MNLWLDDIRTPPDGSWTWVKTPEDAIYQLLLGHVVFASLDHDLGINPAKLNDFRDGLIKENEAEMTGYEVVVFMAENNVWPSEGVSVHSMNPIGAQRMLGVVDRYGPYDRPCRWVQAP